MKIYILFIFSIFSLIAQADTASIAKIGMTGSTGSGAIVVANQYNGVIGSVNDIQVSASSVSIGGQSFPREAGSTTLVQDKEGKTYGVDEDGQKAEIGKQTKDAIPGGNKGGYSAGSDPTPLAKDKGQIVFAAYANQKYGFDRIENDKLKANYDFLGKNSGGDYQIPWKSVKTAGMDKVSYSGNASGGYKLKFRTKAGFEYKPEGGSLNIVGTKHGDIQEIYAIAYKDSQDQHVIGKLQAMTLAPIKNVVYVVKTNTSQTLDKAQIKTYLDKVYDQAVMHWEVEIVDNYKPNVSLGTNGLDIGKDDTRKDLSEEMKALRDDFKKQGLVNREDQQTYYVFLVDQFSDPAIDGYFPQSKLYGFVRYSSQANTLHKTLAHELGHGAGNLEHPFVQYQTTQGSTPLLMDYSGGSQLSKTDWGMLHNPGIRTGWKDAVGEGQQVNTSLVFLTPERKPFRFNLPPSNTGFLLVNNGLKNLNKDNNGTINAFLVDGVEYFYDYEKKEFKSDGNKYINYLTNNPKNISLLIYYGDCKVARLEKEITNYQSINTQIIGNPRTYDYCKGEKPKLNEGNGGTGVYTKKVKQVNVSSYSTTASDKFVDSLAQMLADQIDENIPVQVNLYSEKAPNTALQNGVVLNVKHNSIWDILEIKPLFYVDGKPSFDQAFYSCLDEKIASNLALLKESQSYKINDKPTQKIRELSTVLFTMAIDGIICKIGDKGDPKDDCIPNVLKGATVEILSMLNIPNLVNGIEVLGESFLAKCYKNHKQLLKDNYAILRDLAKGEQYKNVTKQATYATGLKTYFALSFPGSGCVNEKDLKQVGNILDQLKHHYTGGCYQYGKLAVLIIPMVVTGGEWALTKLQKIQTFTKVNKSLIRYIVTLNEELAAKEVFLEIVEGTNNIIVKKADGTILKTIKSTELGLPATATAEEIEVAMQKEIENELKKFAESVRLVPELTESVIKHINKGEIKYVFKDARLPGGKKEFKFSSDKIWAELEADFSKNGEFTQLLFDNSYNKPTIDFTGMHNYDNFQSFTHTTSPTGKLFKSSGTEVIGEVGGKKAYTIKDPEVWIPDLNNLVSKNKFKQVQNRVWDGEGKWQLKKAGPEGRLSSCFIEGMSEAEINQMISDAFSAKNKQWFGTQWESTIIYKGKNITLRGYTESEEISSVFIKKID